MPTYDWHCQACSRSWEVLTLISRRDDPAYCPDCCAEGVRDKLYVTQINQVSAGDWNKVEYNPGLGAWTKSRKHAAQIAKSKGLIELGSEKPDAVHKHFDNQRKETAAQRWAEADRDKVYGD